MKEPRELVSELSQRYWEPHHLTDALWAPGLAQFTPLLDRLQRGEPINVVAWGSSVVQDHGGCFQPSIQHVAGIVPQLPRTLRHTGLCNHFENGWLHNFMQRVNATWPHANHTLVNGGLGGSTLSHNLRFCYDDLLPGRVDLWLLENMDGKTHPPHLEEVLWTLLRRSATAGQPRPPIVLLNTATLVEPDLGTPSLQCARNASLCASLCPDAPPGSGPESGFRTTVVGDSYRIRNNGVGHLAAQLGHYYGITVLSHAQFYEGLLRDGFHKRRNWSECMLLTAAQMDEIHPNPLGRVLLADYLVNVLRLAERHAAELPHVGPPGLPALPMFPDGHSAQLSRCYMSDEGDSSVGPGGNYTRLQVLRNEGWTFIEYYNNSHGHTLYKPGFYANSSGAVFEMRVDPSWPPGMAKEDRTRVVVTFLKSWDHMGVAEMSCSGGCACNSTLLDGWHDQRTSIQYNVESYLTHISSTAPSDCTLRFVVQPATRDGAGGHRFKLVNVAVSADPAMQGAFEFPPWTGFASPAAAAAAAAGGG